jgi:pilus assembly protein CpaE
MNRDSSTVPTMRSRGRLVVVASAKGGTGKSLVATNLAIAWSQFARLNVALVDLDLQFGNADLLLGDLAMDHHHTIADLLPVIDELTLEHLDFAMQQHPSGLRVLLAPKQTGQAYQITPDDIKCLLAALQQHFDWVICDCPGGADEPTLAAMSFADLILLIVTPDIPCLRGTQRLLEMLRAPEKPEALDWLDGPKPYFPGQLGLIVNQFDESNPLTPKQIFQVLQVQTWATLPIDPRSVWRNVSQGRPLVLDAPRGAGEAMRKLAEAIARMIWEAPRAGNRDADR